MEYRYTAIVLEKREIGETDRLYTLYTREAGKQRVVAKGVRKSQAKLAASLETGNLVVVNIVRGRGMGKVVGAVTESTYPYMRMQFIQYQEIVGVLAAFARLVEEDGVEEEVFDLLQVFLESVNQENQEREIVRFLVYAFWLKLYALLGYQLHVSTCQHTGEALVREKRYLFDPYRGGFVCVEAAATTTQAFLVSHEVISLVRIVLKNNLKNLLKIQNAKEYAKELGRVQEQFYAWMVR